MCAPTLAQLTIIQRNERRREEAKNHQTIMWRNGRYSDKWHAHVKLHRDQAEDLKATGGRDDMRITNKGNK